MFEQSRKALSSIIQILQKMLDAFSIILFAVFTLFYGYQIFAHIHDPIGIIIIYILLIGVHTTVFVFARTTKIEGATHAERYEQRREKRNKKRIFKIIKLSINSAAILWNVIEIFTSDVGDLRIMIVIISAVLLFAQILMEIILNLMLVYFDNFRIAVIEDIRSIDMDSNIISRVLTKSLGIKKALKDIKDEDYFSETEKEIAERQKRELNDKK